MMNKTRLCLIPIKLNTTANLKVKPGKDQKLGFGRITTDYMLNIDYTRGKGWHDARIEPYQPLQLDPATLVLHYGQGIFEGLKAYRTKSNKIQLFRPQANMKRMNESCKIIQMPSIDEKEVLTAITKLVELEKDWVPSAPGATLYIRPTIIATDPFLGVRAGDTYRLFVILSPVDAYYPEGFNPVKIFVTKDYVRAVRGGLGAAKTMANYAASLGAGELAHQLGYAQVLWLDGIEQKYIEEVGSMNIFFVINNVLTTPVLNGSILAGVTRDSVLTLGRQWGLKVEERRISLDEILESYDKGTLTEIFGTGTAAVISPVKELRYGDRVIKLSDKPGPVAQRFYNDLQAIQFGLSPDTNGWIHPVC